MDRFFITWSITNDVGYNEARGLLFCLRSLLRCRLATVWRAGNRCPPALNIPGRYRVAPAGGDMTRHQLRQAKMSVVRLVYSTVVTGLLLMNSATQAFVSIHHYVRAFFGTKYCDRRICKRVCLSIRISQKPHSKFHEILCTCYLWPWLGPPLTTVQYVIYFRFCGWHHISYNGINGTEPKSQLGFAEFAKWRHRRRSCCLRLQAYFELPQVCPTF